jgi:hypothetical protein
MRCKPPPLPPSKEKCAGRNVLLLGTQLALEAVQNKERSRAATLFMSNFFSQSSRSRVEEFDIDPQTRAAKESDAITKEWPRIAACYVYV